MKKLFFFRSSSSNNGNDNADSPASTDKQFYWQNPSESELDKGDKTGNSFRSPRGLFSKSRKQGHDSPSSGSGSGLRRSRSLSSAAFFSDGLPHKNFSGISDQGRSPCSSTSGALQQQCKHSFSGQARTPQKQAKAKKSEVTTIYNAHGLETLGSSASSKFYHDSSANSSSSNVSSIVLDRYIDGEQQQERSKPKNSYSQRHLSGSGNASGRLPPWIQHTAPTSPTDSVKDKPRSHSFREAKGTHLHFSSRGWVEHGFGHESPQRLAKNVVERLSQTRAIPKSSLKEFDNGIPITIEDIYDESATGCFDSRLDVPVQKNYSLGEPYETFNDLHGVDFSGFQKHKSFLGGSLGDVSSCPLKDMTDVELQRRSKEAEERVVLLSEEIELESFLQENGFDLPSFVQTIRNLVADKMSLAIEVSGLLKCQIADRDSAREELRLAKSELESQTRRLEKEKSELQSALEKELDRRSSDWSSKLKKYQLEEQRLRERVRELAEQNVSLQREVSCFNQRETESRSVITYSEQQLRHLTSKVEELSVENQDLRQCLSDLQENYKVAGENIICIKSNFEQKDKECKGLQRSIARLLRTCSDQEKTISGMQEAMSQEIEKKQPLDKFDKHVEKLQMEQIRLTGVELALRKEVESLRLEVDSLRNENINLLNRLKDNGKETDALTFKIDSEMQTRVCCLQNQGLKMLNESTHLCSKLLENIKGKASQLSETRQGIEPMMNGLDAHFFVESDMKVNGLKCGTESLTRSLQTISSLLQEKSSLVASKPQTPFISSGGLGKPDHGTSELTLSFELRAESLLNTLLREKLHSKELEVEQLQAELAAAVRGNDILCCEVQNAQDSLSSGTHKFKDLELQMLKKDENISRLQSDLQDCSKELTMFKGILPNVSEERDLMWEEVKQYNEKNMLLNSEVNLLKKKIEALDEDILLKEGQITILKDTLGNRPFDLLASPDSTRDFLLK